MKVATGFLTVLMMAGAAQAADTKGMPGDAMVTANVMAANEAEIQAGKLAQTKATNKEVKSFAQHMVDEHTKNDQQVASLSKDLKVAPKPDDGVQAMKVDAKQKIENLAQKSGAEFDKAYMNLQVEMHTQVLAQIESKLLPAAKNEAMKTFLNQTKGHVAQHLEMAKKIQSTLK